MSALYSKTELLCQRDNLEHAFEHTRLQCVLFLLVNHIMFSSILFPWKVSLMSVAICRLGSTTNGHKTFVIRTKSGAPRFVDTQATLLWIFKLKFFCIVDLSCFLWHNFSLYLIIYTCTLKTIEFRNWSKFQTKIKKSAIESASF